MSKKRDKQEVFNLDLTRRRRDLRFWTIRQVLLLMLLAAVVVSAWIAVAHGELPVQAKGVSASQARGCQGADS
jgi:hypothetical protein